MTVVVSLFWGAVLGARLANRQQRKLIAHLFASRDSWRARFYDMRDRNVIVTTAQAVHGELTSRREAGR